jgi:hypothetical protein
MNIERSGKEITIVLASVLFVCLFVLLLFTVTTYMIFSGRKDLFWLMVSVQGQPTLLFLGHGEQNIMVEGHGGKKLLISWPRSRKI